MCNIVVSTETPQTSTNPSQTLLPVYKLAHLPLPHPSPHLNLSTCIHVSVHESLGETLKVRKLTASGRDLILTSVAHLRKKAKLRLWGFWR